LTIFDLPREITALHISCGELFAISLSSLCALWQFLLTDCDFLFIIDFAFQAFSLPSAASFEKKLKNIRFFFEFILTPDVY